MNLLREKVADAWDALGQNDKVFLIRECFAEGTCISYNNGVVTSGIDFPVNDDLIIFDRTDETIDECVLWLVNTFGDGSGSGGIGYSKKIRRLIKKYWSQLSRAEQLRLVRICFSVDDFAVITFDPLFSKFVVSYQVPFTDFVDLVVFQKPANYTMIDYIIDYIDLDVCVPF